MAAAEGRPTSRGDLRCIDAIGSVVPSAKRGMLMDDASGKYVHPDHWSPEHRDLIAHLRAQHLPGVDTDDEALVAGTIEQARLLLVTAGGLLGLTLTKLLDLERSVCAVPICIEVVVLCAALLLGWMGLLTGLKLRAQRVDRRYDIYNAHLDAHMQAAVHQRLIDLKNFETMFDASFDPERSSSRLIGRLRFWAALLTSLGIAMAAVAVIGTVAPDRCFGEVQIGGRDNAPAQARVSSALGDPS